MIEDETVAELRRARIEREQADRRGTWALSALALATMIFLTWAFVRAIPETRCDDGPPCMTTRR
jgi:hypothetical protein